MAGCVIHPVHVDGEHARPHGPDRASGEAVSDRSDGARAGADRAAVGGGMRRGSSAQDRFAGSAERDPASRAHGLRVADAAEGLSAVAYGVVVVPPPDPADALRDGSRAGRDARPPACGPGGGAVGGGAGQPDGGACDRAGLMDEAALRDFTIEVVRKIGGQTGFRVLPRRWVVERTFAWMTRGDASCATARPAATSPKP